MGDGGRLLRLAEATWSEIAALDRERLVALLPVGAVEAHGPHLPLSTDGIIATAMAAAAGRRLAARGRLALLLPALDYTAAPFAAAFPGTVAIAPETFRRLLLDIAGSLASQGVRCLAIANSHLDPAHLVALREAVAEIGRRGRPAVAFPDLTRRPWASRLGAEFASGACHAGRYEGSVVLAERPDLVRRELARSLPPNPSSLVRAIAGGQRTFHEAGGPQAYFGDPAAATADEGRETVEVLGAILEESVLAALATRGGWA